MENRFYQT